MHRTALWALLPAFLFTPFLSAQDFKVVGYLPHYYFDVADQIAFDKLTHLNLAFANPDMAGNLDLDGSEIAPIVEMAHEADVQVLVSVAGGVLFPEWWEAWQHLIQPQNRSAFIHKLVSYLLANDLQGIDVDLEWNNVNEHYSGFVLELRDSLDQYDLLMTAALPGTYLYPHISDEALAAYDFINMMAYDLTGPWDPGNPGPHSPYSFALDAIDFWKWQGVEGERLTLGVPFYGYDFTNVNDVHAVTFRSMVEMDPAYAQLDKVGEIYYNGIPTIQAKTALAISEVSGIMMWHLAQDAFDDNSLLKAIDEEVNNAVAYEDHKPETDLEVYPNPFADWLHIQTEDRSAAKLTLTDARGRPVLRKAFPGTGVISLNTGALPKGFYFITVVNKERVVTRKLIKN